MYNYTVMRQVPPRIVKFDYMEPTSTSTMTLDVYEMCITTAGVIFVKSDYDVHDYIRCGFRQVPLRICQVRLHDASSTSTVDPVGVKFLSERVPQLPLRCVRLLPTTTRGRLPPLRPVNDYFLYETRSAPNARFKGITPRRRPR